MNTLQACKGKTQMAGGTSQTGLSGPPIQTFQRAFKLDLQAELFPDSSKYIKDACDVIWL